MVSVRHWTRAAACSGVGLTLTSAHTRGGLVPKRSTFCAKADAAVTIKAAVEIAKTLIKFLSVRSNGWQRLGCSGFQTSNSFNRDELRRTAVFKKLLDLIVQAFRKPRWFREKLRVCLQLVPGEFACGIEQLHVHAILLLQNNSSESTMESRNFSLVW